MAVHGIVEALAIVSVFGIAGGTITSVARTFFNRPGKRASLPSSSEAQLQERLEQLENAVQAIAIQTERIAEGQRFTTRLLSQTAAPTPSAALPTSPSPNTVGEHAAS